MRGKMPSFNEPPLNSRPDPTPFLFHMKRSTSSNDGYLAYDNLLNILKEGVIWGSSNKKGFTKGPNRATCFMDVPFASLKYILAPNRAEPQKPRYEPYGIMLRKFYTYDTGCRAVLYMSDEELKSLRIRQEELWRVVRFEVANENWISWIHKREWRSKGDFKLPIKILSVLVKDLKEAGHRREIKKTPKKFKCKPKSIIPLSIVCKGLIN